MNNRDLSNEIYAIAGELKELVPRVIADTINVFNPEEDNRIAAENARERSEGERRQNETARQSNEDVRQQNEGKRMAVIGDISEALGRLSDMIDGEASVLYYPVGAVYISFESTSPSRWYGGTWEKLEAGRFLMAGESSGIKQGNRYHSHLGSGLYADIHMSSTVDGDTIIHWQDAGAERSDEVGNWGFYPRDNMTFEPSNSVASGSEYSRGITVDGTTSEAEALPPYITVHMWRRIA